MPFNNPTNYRCQVAIAKGSAEFHVASVYSRRLPCDTGVLLDKYGGGVVLFTPEEIDKHFLPVFRVECQTSYPSVGTPIFHRRAAYWAAHNADGTITVFAPGDSKTIHLSPALFSKHFVHQP